MPKSKAKVTMKDVNKAIDRKTETKHRSISVSLAPISTYAIGSPRTDHLTSIATGTSNATRIGNRIRVSRIKGQYSVVYADSTNVVRFIIARYKKQWEANPFAGIEVYTCLDLDDWDVLVDRFVTVGTNNPTKRFFFNKSIKRSTQITYDDTGSNDVNVNPYFMYTVSDSGAVSHPTITGCLRIFWKDM